MGSCGGVDERTDPPWADPASGGGMKLYNTLTRSIEPFTPLAPPTVTMYACGPTVYDVPHIGHARSAYVFDVIRRYLEFQGYRVRFIRNVTDVDDKIIDRARQALGAGGTGDLKEACRVLTERYLTSYHEALGRLGVGCPTDEPRATDHVVPEMTDFIAQLLVNGVAYEAGGDVYFSVRKFPGYGVLSNRTLDELQAGARVEPGERKQDPLDFALWKAAKPEEPSWDSPWGKGRPGWHIECSTMSTKLLGDDFDIHGGGLDLIFPHHENEIAQAQALGKGFARCWVHNGLLTVRGEKMSKSQGNWLTLEEVFADFPHPDHLKIFFLKTHYRSPIDFSKARMDEAKRNWEEFSWLIQHVDQLPDRVTPGAAPQKSASDGRSLFTEAMDDDVNTPKAMAALFDLTRRGREALQKGTADESATARSCVADLLDLGMVLGLFQQGVADVNAQARTRIEALIKERDGARQRKDFSRADAIRTSLQDEGYHLTDTPRGTLWRQLK